MKTYFGLKDGFHCLGPMSNGESFNKPQTDKDYNCTRPNIPNWQSKWYSPVCRTWYKQQKTQWESNKKTRRGIMTSLYTFAGDNVPGITSCAPLLKRKAFAGVMCLDIAP